MDNQDSETGLTERQVALDSENMPAEATRRRGLVGRLRARPKLTVALLVAAMATAPVGVYAHQNGYLKHYDDTPAGVVEHVIDIVLIHKRERQPSPLPGLLCTPDNNRLGGLRWTIVKNMDYDKNVGRRYRFTTGRWSVTETGPRARVTVEITALVEKDPQKSVTQLWEFNLERTDHWRTCSSSQIK
jgi:hypothetical protein